MISVTGFTADTSPTREQVKCAIDMVGACYLGPLCKGQTTHLICMDPSSEKYKAVQSWDRPILCVNYHWLFDCLRDWRHADEASYSFTKGYSFMKGDGGNSFLKGDEGNSFVKGDGYNSFVKGDEGNSFTKMDKTNSFNKEHMQKEEEVIQSLFDLSDK